MQPKDWLFLMPLTWAILIYILAGKIDSIVINSIVSFMIAVVAVVTVSGLHIAGSGIGNSETSFMLFAMFFGLVFYGFSVGNVLFSSAVPQGVNPAIIGLPQWQSEFQDQYGTNASYNGTMGGFGTTANSQSNFLVMFRDMPYFNFIAIIFAIMYILGIYFRITSRGM